MGSIHPSITPIHYICSFTLPIYLYIHLSSYVAKLISLYHIFFHYRIICINGGLLTWPTRYLRWPTKVRLSTLTLGIFYIFHRLWWTRACNEIVRVSKVSGASKAGEVSQPVRAKLAGAGGPVQADRTVKVLNLCRLRYLTFVG